MPLTIRDALLKAQSKLAHAGIKNSYQEARLLLKYALHFSLEEILVSPHRELTPKQLEKYENWVLRRSSYEPLSKIKQEKEFWSLPFIVNAETLDPRPDSETLIETVLKTYPSRERVFNILDLGVGTGCLIIALLHEYPFSFGLGVDKSAEALKVAQLNSERFNLQARLRLIQTSWGEEVNEKFDIVISNPPYIPEKERQMLSPEVIHYDPGMALFGGEDGLEAYRSLAPHVFRLLKFSGHLFLEIGQGQEKAVEKILQASGLILQEWIPDLAGIIRCGIFQKASE